MMGVPEISPPQSPRMTAHATLRDQTREWHLRVEEAFDWRRRFATQASYRELLMRLREVIAPLERALAENVGVSELRGWRPGLLTGWIDADLDRLMTESDGRRSQENAAAEGLGGLPPNWDWTELKSGVPAAGGCLYVLLGSLLGGQILARELRDRLKIDSSTGSRYFNGHGSETPQRWGEFVEWLNSQVFSVEAVQTATESAEKTFHWFFVILKHEQSFRPAGQ